MNQKQIDTIYQAIIDIKAAINQLDEDFCLLCELATQADLTKELDNETKISKN